MLVIKLVSQRVCAFSLLEATSTFDLNFSLSQTFSFFMQHFQDLWEYNREALGKPNHCRQLILWGKSLDPTIFS
jgi:hypothetical protein